MAQRFAVALVIAAIHALFIPTFATERGIVQAGRQHARQLILSTEDLMSPSTWHESSS